MRFGSVSMWYFVVLLTNVTYVWLLWFRKPEPRVSSRAASRPRAIMTHEMLSPTSSTGFTSGSDISKETSSSKLRLESATLQASAAAIDDQVPKRATFLGKINGVKTSAGASLKMCATEIVTGCWMHVDATRFNVRQGLMQLASNTCDGRN